MLGLFSSKSSHPLLDARETKRVLAEIAGRDPQDAVEEAANWLESLTTAEGFRLSLRLERILQIDEAALAAARRSGRDFLTQPRASRTLETRLWQVNRSYWQQLVAAYNDCLVRYHQPEKDADAMRAQLPLLYVRLMHALAAQLKWDQFRYGPIAPDFWMTLGGAYLAAFDTRTAQKPLSPYPGSSDTTVEAEYLKALVFQASSMDKLTPLQIELAERFVNYFLPFFTLIREVRPENVYWVDAAKPVPPTRLAKLPEVTPTLRFFNGTRAVDAVHKTLEQIRQEGRVPPGIQLGARYETAEVIPVLEHLAMCWAPVPPMRTHSRHRVKSELTVVHGLDAIHRRLIGDSISEAETWLVDDVSQGGMGALVPSVRSDWIHIGVLVGLQPAGGDNWLLGVVRRFQRGCAGESAVGIETLSKTPRGVMADAGGLQTEAILLDVPVVGEYARMVLHPAALEDKVALIFALDGLRARLHPRETLSTGGDFVVANFFVQSYS